jgi:Ca-activated chloride channel family protein
MEARDLVRDDQSVSRLAVVKERFIEFVTGGESGQGRKDDAIGLVAFARWADGLCPLTLDHGSLLSIVADTEIVAEPQEDGTALGEGLGLAVERLRSHTARSRIAILLTDGVNNTGDITPAQAAELAKANDVKVYCIGTGTRGLAPVPATDPFTGRTYLRRMPVQIDEATLKEIAHTTGGRYFRATDDSSMADIYREIDSLERTEISEKRYLSYHEKYLAFVATALMLLGLGCGLGGTLLRRLP